MDFAESDEKIKIYMIEMCKENKICYIY